MITKSDILDAKILIVDDQELDIRLIEEFLLKEGFRNITKTVNPAEVLDLYQRIKPDLLIVDIFMPVIDGFQIIQQVKALNPSEYLPILVLSTEGADDIRLKALTEGAKDYLVKPYNRVEALKRIRNLVESRLLHNQIRDQNFDLENKVKLRTQELYETQVDVIQRLARAIEYRDSETGLHTLRMSHYSVSLAEKAGLSTEELEQILIASPLHDIGKIGIPDSILRKPGKLTPEEWAVMKTHTTIGEELLSGSNSEYLNTAKMIAVSHHEKWDGTGYPYGLREEKIPLLGRICGVCDVFDALTSDRPYKRAWDFQTAIDTIVQEKGRHFDPRLVDCFLEIKPQIQYIQNKFKDPQAE